MRLFIILLFGFIFSQSVRAIDYGQDNMQLSKGMKYFNESTVQSDCSNLSNGQWHMIAWFFSRVGSYINVTEIVRESELNRHKSYIGRFIKDLYHYTGLKYHNHRVKYRDIDESIDKMNPHPTNPYIWHTEFEMSENYTGKGLEVDKQYIRSKLLKQNRQREDEPEFGSVVLVTDIKIIDHFANGPTRYPFESRRTHYVIIIHEEYDKGVVNWESIVSKVLAKLWRGHSILNVIILSTCTHQFVSFELNHCNVCQN